MTTLRAFWRNFSKKEKEVEAQTETATTAFPAADAQPFDLDIASNDPFLTYCLNSKGVIDVEALLLDTPAVRGMKAAGVKLVVPLISQGDLIGLINLGPRRSEQEYTGDDYKLLQDLSTHAAPALKLAQLV
jgi:GAF domain-containing protein